MRIYIIAGLEIAALAAVGGLYYFHTSKVPPPPKDLTAVLPPQLLARANAQQLEVLRGKAASISKLAADKVSQTPTATPDNASGAPASLAVTLAVEKPGQLTGQAVNSTDAPLVYAYPVGTLFSNGTGDLILLKAVSVEVPAKSTADLSLEVVQVSSGNGVLKGSNFNPHAGTVESLQPLLKLLAEKTDVSRNVAQTAILIVNDDVPLDVIASFPRLRPATLANDQPKPFSASPGDLIAALTLIRESGIDPATTALMGEPQLKVMTMLNPDSHAAAMDFFGITEQTHWAYWKAQLQQGDPSLRHYALYGIARYYPNVALQMMPVWVRSANLTRNYRLSAAWALALIDDPRAQKELQELRQEMSDDPGLRQALDRALRHRGDRSGKPVDAKA